MLNGSQAIQKGVLTFCFNIACAEGEVTEKEKKLLEYACNSLRINYKEFNTYLNRVEDTEWKSVGKCFDNKGIGKSYTWDDKKTIKYPKGKINLGGIEGDLCWIEDKFKFCDSNTINSRLSSYPLAIFPPRNQTSNKVPLVIGLQGLSARYELNEFIVPTLVNKGYAVALFETPLAGERSLARTYQNHPFPEVEALIENGGELSYPFLKNIFDCVSENIKYVKQVCAQDYGFGLEKLCLFGVSMGGVQAAYTFSRFGIGDTLLCAIANLDIQSFSKTWLDSVLNETAPMLKPFSKLIMTSSPLINIVDKIRGDFCTTLNDLQSDKNCSINPITYASTVDPSRKVRLLLGEKDPVIDAREAKKYLKFFRNSECYIVPGLAHGSGNFVNDVRYFLETQL